MRRDGLSVLMTADAVGGVWTYSLDLASALARRGARVRLVVVGPRPSAAQRQNASRIPGIELVECGYDLEWMDDPWDGVARTGELLVALARDFRPDVVHLNGYTHADLDFGAPKLVVGHSCVLSWWAAVKSEPLPPRYAKYRERVARGLAAADLVVTPTAAMLDALHVHYGVSEGAVIPNGRDSHGPPPGAKAPMVLCAARAWDEAKNVETLARAAAGLAWPVYVAGDGATRLANVHPLGRLDPEELVTWFQRAAIYALPARYEPFGLSVLEAALAGSALVLGDIPSLREVWGDAAVFVAPDDERALRDALCRLVREDERRRDLARRARKRAKLFSLERMVTSYEAAYERLVSAARGRAAGRASPEDAPGARVLHLS